MTMPHPYIPSLYEIEKKLRELLPTETPAVARAVVEAPRKGWCKAEYYDALTGEKFSFYDMPSVVAVALLREGPSRVVTAPAIEIPTVKVPSVPSITIPEISMPEAPTIAVPTVTLPPPAEVTVPTFSIPYAPSVGGRFKCGALTQWICDQLNPMLDNIDTAIARLNEAIYAINKAFAETRESLIATIDEISEFRDNAQTALNDYSGKIKTSVDAGLADLKAKTEATLSEFRRNVEATVSAAMRDYARNVQAAFNEYRNNIQVSVNAGLSQFIPTLYDMMGLPPPEVSAEDAARLREMGDVNGDGVIDDKDVDLVKKAYGSREGDPNWNPACDLNHNGVVDAGDVAIVSRNYGKSVVPTAQLISPVQIRNVTRDGFEFYGLSTGMKLAYVAVGKRK